MISIAEIIADPDFAQSFTVNRTTGTLLNGRWQMVVTPMTEVSGVIIPEDTAQALQSPQGDAITGKINIYTLDQLYTTGIDETGGSNNRLADEVIWQGQSWKILEVRNLSDFGYFHSVAVRKLGA